MSIPDNRTGIYHDFPDGRREIRVELLDAAQAAIYRSWTPRQRLEAGMRESRFARELLRAAVRRDHPAWSEEQVAREVARRTLGGYDR